MYHSLLADFDLLRQRTARFRRVALHIHSPDSHDWASGAPDVARNQRSRFDGDSGLAEFCSELKPHLDMAGITDHMRCSFATRLSSRCCSPDEFCVLPGMEVNLELASPLNFARIHLLAILPESSSTDSFACLFNGLPDIPRDDASRNGREEVKGLSLKDWVHRVHNENGLCIAAHVENGQGVRYCFRQTARETLRLFYDGDDATVERENDVPETFRDYLFDSGLDAIEIHKSSDVTHYRWISEKDGRTRSMATVLTFDAHYCESFGRADRTTHIKMTSLGLAGLKNALRFPDTRIRFPDNLPPAPNPRLLGISISGDENSFFEDVEIALAENLNCLIGVRGSGKSTVVEALRYVFGYNRTLQDLGKPMADSIQEMQRANLTGSLIQVTYRLKSDEVRVLSATFDEKAEYATKVYSVEGDLLEVADVEECGDYPLRLFGWSEIETLGRSPARQRDLLDRLVPELPPALRRRESLRQELRRNRGVLAKAIEEVKARPFEHDKHADTPVLADNGNRLETLLELQETPWDDYETILLDGDPVNEKSPGQRSSAMLPLIALAEDTPLVIDQPEDNLDKRLIGSVLMKVLAELKEKRQITVCTHDPNILVGGDAEQVIVLEAESNRKGKVGDHGSIDNDNIVNIVIDLLEGGAEAFETRQRRYGLEGESLAT